MLTLATATTQPLPPHFWFIFSALAVLSCAMVYAMVQFSRAVLCADALDADDQGEEARAVRRSKQTWRVLYVLIWAGLAVVLLTFLNDSPGGNSTHNYLILLLVVGGFWLVHWFILRFALALQRAGARPLDANTAPEPDTDDASDADTDDASETELPLPPLPPGEGRGEGELTSDPDHSAADLANPAPPASGVRDTLKLIRNIAIILVICFIAQAVPFLRNTSARVDAHRRQILPVSITLAVVGTFLLAAGGAAMALGKGRSMTRAQIDAMTAAIRRRQTTSIAQKYVYRNFGTVMGLEARDEVSFAQFKAAVRIHAWRYSPRWRIIFMMALGALLLTIGLFTSIAVMSPAGIKLIILLALAYATVRTTYAMYRA